MAKSPPKKVAKTFSREDKVRTLKRRGNAAWRKELTRDLQEFGADDEGASHLAAAIKAVLRSDRWKR